MLKGQCCRICLLQLLDQNVAPPQQLKQTAPPRYRATLKIAVGSEIDCELVDLSATGIAFYSRKEYRLGQLQQVVLVYQGTVHNGHGTIQSIRRMQPKTWRYGMHCTDRGQDTLARSLASINFAIQAEQRRRLSRT